MSGIEHNAGSGKNSAAIAKPAAQLATIALSAAGLQPLRDVIRSLPGDFPAAVIVLQHIGAHSELPGILRAATRLRVKFAEPDEMLCSGTVYVCPPGVHTIVTPGRTLCLSRAPAVRWSRPSADWLFESAAASFSDCAVAVILSGRLTDGARGVRWMHRAGGHVIAQLPSTCGFASMPRAAISTGCVDAVLPPDQIGAALQRAVDRQRASARVSDWEEPFLAMS